MSISRGVDFRSLSGLPLALFPFFFLIFFLWWDQSIHEKTASTWIVPESLANQVNLCMPGTGVGWEMPVIINVVGG